VLQEGGVEPHPRAPETAEPQRQQAAEPPPGEEAGVEAEAARQGSRRLAVASPFAAGPEPAAAAAEALRPAHPSSRLPSGWPVAGRPLRPPEAREVKAEAQALLRQEVSGLEPQRPPAAAAAAPAAICVPP
jgi:hypothetical protein